MLDPLLKLILDLHDRQYEVFSNPARFRVLVAGRRFGKTHLALTEMLYTAAKFPNSVSWYVGPNNGQSKHIAWDRLKKLTQPYWSKDPNETDLRIDLSNGSTLFVYGAFNPESLRGRGIDFLVLDEFALIDPQAWFSVLRPALADRKGRVLFIGTPQGRNHFFDMYEFAKITPDWAAFQFTTEQGGIVDKSEIEAAAGEMDSETFESEFLAQFSSLARNRVYYAFDKSQNVQSVSFNGQRPLVWSIDFNVNPMSMLLMQKVDDMAHVLEEIILKPDGYTEVACERFGERALTYYNQVPTYQRPLIVKIYGDASGNQRRTAGSQTDWATVREFFSKWVGTFAPEYYITSANPPVRDRIACVNRRLRTQSLESRLMVDPKCKELIRDLEDVTWQLDSTGAVTSEINKSDKNRTHTSDALGYFIYQAFPLNGKIGEKPDGPLLSF